MYLYSILCVDFVLLWVMSYMFMCILFFKQKTAYEMRISGWSSDVCSSDLLPRSHRLRRSHSASRAAPRSPYRTARAMGPGNKCRDDSLGYGKRDRKSVV